MLTHIDVFIGVAIVMLGVSLLLTIVTQMVSFAINFRGRQLKRGLAELFLELKLANAEPLARAILLHPLIADGLGKARFAPAISKVDLLALLGRADTLLDLVDKGQKDALRETAKEVEVWFDSTMSRVANRFALQTRLVTIAVALIAAFALQLDAFGLVTRLYQDSELRTRIAGAAEGVLEQGERILQSPSAFADAAAFVAKEKSDVLSPPAATIHSREQAVTWIRDTVTDPKQADAVVSRYDVVLGEALAPTLNAWTTDLREINGKLSGVGVQLIPTPYQPFQCPSLLGFLGMLTSAGLLSLGAPFWFNMLKTATNLRPAMANAVQSRDEAAAKKASKDG